jgi:hypothetical protein
MALRDRMRRICKGTDLRRQTHVCPECKEEFVVYGDVAVDYIVAEWARGVEETGSLVGPYKTPEDVAALLDHEHDSWKFVDKKAGLPFMSREVSGMNPGSAPYWTEGHGV